MRTGRILPLLFAVAIAASASTSLGAESDEQPKTIVLRVAPARPPYRALRDHLLPTRIELTTGNAAPLYLKACLLTGEQTSPEDKNDTERLSTWMETPIDELPVEDARRVLEGRRGVLDLVKIAARREDCDWDMPFREENFANILLPEVRPLRWIARLVALDARVKFATGDRPGAIEAIRTGLALGRHFAAGTTLIHGLVGINIAETHLEALREGLQSSPDNLYWVLATLPTPLVDISPGVDFDRDGVYWIFPTLRSAATAQRPPAEWQAEWEELLKSPELIRIATGSEPKLDVSQLSDPATAAAMLARAKTIAAREGWSKKRIAGCSNAQLLLAGTALGFEHARDEMFKWMAPWTRDDSPQQAAADAAIEKAGEQEVIPLAPAILPALMAARRASYRLQRTVAALATVEGLRFYAATHQGRFPAALADIEEMPLPTDPFSGAPFRYAVADNIATLSASAPKGQPASAYVMNWQIHIAK